jgi:hypothetical protein
VATSIDDLLRALDDSTSPGRPVDLRDASRCLTLSGHLLARSCATYPRYAASRTWYVASLATACSDAGPLLPEQAGRASQLLGAASDVAGRLEQRLAPDDRWSIAIEVAGIARRCAEVVRSDPAYLHVYQYATVSRRASDLLRYSATDIPAIQPETALHHPLAQPNVRANSAGSVVLLESIATMINELHRLPPTDVSIRSLRGIAIAADATANRAAELSVGRDDQRMAARCKVMAASWREFGSALPRFVDGQSAGFAGDRLVVATVRAREALLDACKDPAGTALLREQQEALVRSAALLPRLAAAAEDCLRGKAGHLLVPIGPRPLREERVAEWLARRTFIAGRRDTGPAIESLAPARSTTLDR